jgi:hypothetical protein
MRAWSVPLKSWTGNKENFSQRTSWGNRQNKKDAVEFEASTRAHQLERTLALIDDNAIHWIGDGSTHVKNPRLSKHCERVLRRSRMRNTGLVRSYGCYSPQTLPLVSSVSNGRDSFVALPLPNADAAPRFWHARLTPGWSFTSISAKDQHKCQAGWRQPPIRACSFWVVSIAVRI